MLFDNVPAPLRRYLKDHEVITAPTMCCMSFNGDLLAVAERGGFDIMVTADQNFSYQQNLSGCKIALVVSSTNDWSLIKQTPERVVSAVNAVTAGSFQEVKFDFLPRDLTNALG